MSLYVDFLILKFKWDRVLIKFIYVVYDDIIFVLYIYCVDLENLF